MQPQAVELKLFRRVLLLASLCVYLSLPTPLRATDFFLTIGGGYDPEGNQASLEANVLFFQEVLQAQHRGQRTQATFFADGDDPHPDLQVLKPKSQGAGTASDSGPVADLLEQLFTSRNGEQEVEYRNHHIENISGPNRPESIRASLQHMCGNMVDGDRLIVYVTAHGGEAEGLNHYNTTISCWDELSITAREFERWLDDVPASVPVVMVMAQCYCGGFAHTIFDKAQRREGLDARVRVGFFAQQCFSGFFVIVTRGCHQHRFMMFVARIWVCPLAQQVAQNLCFTFFKRGEGIFA